MPFRIPSRRAAVLAASLAVILLQACSTLNVEHYRNTAPQLRIEDYFAGNIRAWGMVQNRSGEVTRRFVVDIRGRAEGDAFVLDEDFVFDDGEKSRRTWRIARTGPNSYRGLADDVVGEARGNHAGNALHWRYDLRLEVDGSSWVIHFDDWMYLQSDGVLINRARMSKFGFSVGEIIIVFDKSSGP